MCWQEIIRLAIQWLMCEKQADRTIGKFREIANHYGDVYGIPAEDREGLLVAYMKLPDWQKPR